MSIKERFYANLNVLREDYDKNAADDAEELRDLGKGKVRYKSDKKIQRMFKRQGNAAAKRAVTGMEPVKKGQRYVGEEQLNELRGKGTIDKKDKEELQGRIRDKHGKAWTETERIRKEKKSKGSEDTKSIDKFRNRLAKIHNKLDEEELGESKWNYPKQLTRTKETSDMGTTNASKNRAARKAIRKKVKAAAHKELMTKKK